MGEIIKPLTLSISKESWERFKQIVPREISLNEAVVQLIESKINEQEVK